MKPPKDPEGKTARAICETTESVALGLACTRTARYETPRNIAIASAPSIASVFAAFFPCGCRKALTPFAIASTPVNAVDPDEKARRRTKTPIVPAPTGSSCGTTARCVFPVRTWTRPTATRARIEVTNAYVGRANSSPDSRTPRRFASTITRRQASDSPTLCEVSEGANDVIA
jgi:hypothetical protein